MIYEVNYLLKERNLHNAKTNNMHRNYMSYSQIQLLSSSESEFGMIG